MTTEAETAVMYLQVKEHQGLSRSREMARDRLSLTVPSTSLCCPEGLCGVCFHRMPGGAASKGLPG